jgi:hypothetical protein
MGAAPALLAATLAVGCGGGNGSNMMGSGTNGSGGTSSGVSFMSMSPASGATGVAAGSAITFRFSGAMGTGM